MSIHDTAEQPIIPPPPPLSFAQRVAAEFQIQQLTPPAALVELIERHQ